MGWPSKQEIEQIGHAIYTYDVIMHQQRFDKPSDFEIHTECREHVDDGKGKIEIYIRNVTGTLPFLLPNLCGAILSVSTIYIYFTFIMHCTATSSRYNLSFTSVLYFQFIFMPFFHHT